MRDGSERNCARSCWDLVGFFKADSETILDVLRIAINRLAEMPENRIMVLLSRGFVAGGMDRRKSAIIKATQSAHIVFGAVNTQGLTTEGDLGRKIVLAELMTEISSATGVRFHQDGETIRILRIRNRREAYR
jgi:hypothetical protein